jgi:hypothetical protein
MKIVACIAAVRERNAVLALAACALTLLCTAQARGDIGHADAQTASQSTQPGTTVQGVSATLEQCVPALTDSERSATFAGEMTTIAGAGRMEIRIDVQERLPGEVDFHNVNAPGLGAWRSSAPGVKAYKFLRQVTNMSAPAAYRGAVRYRWLSPRGRLIRVARRSTPICEEPAPPEGEAPPSAGAGSPATTAG